MLKREREREREKERTFLTFCIDLDFVDQIDFLPIVFQRKKKRKPIVARYEVFNPNHEIITLITQ